MLHHTIYPAVNNSKKWITFIHGAGGSSSIWFNQVRFFKANFNILLIDLRGHGKSESSPDGTQYNFDHVNLKHSFSQFGYNIAKKIN